MSYPKLCTPTLSFAHDAEQLEALGDDIYGAFLEVTEANGETPLYGQQLLSIC